MSSAEKIEAGKALTLVGMIAASIVFLFTTFVTKDTAEEQKKNEASQVEQLNHKIDDLHNDFRDFHHEVIDRFDRLDQSRRSK